MDLSEVEAHLRLIGARTVDDPWRAVGCIRGLCDARECWNSVAAMGYAHEKR